MQRDWHVEPVMLEDQPSPRSCSLTNINIKALNPQVAGLDMLPGPGFLARDSSRTYRTVLV